MKKLLLCVLVLVIFAENSVQADQKDDLLLTMQQKIEELEKRLVTQEAKNAELEERLNEYEGKVVTQIEKVAHSDKHLLSSKEIFPKVVGNLSIAGGLTGVVQGTSGNEDNVEDDGDVTDGSWSGDLELESALGENGLAYILMEAGNGEGLEYDEVTSFHGVNYDSGNSEASVEMTEAWYEHLFFDEKLTLTVGKIDLTNYFDTNEVANDETTQFLSDGFRNSIAVAWPEDNGLGVRALFSPNELIDLSVGWTEADGDWEDISDDSFAIAEIGFKPKFGELQGNYRLYGWYNGTDYSELVRDASSEGYGFGLSADQQIHPLVTIFGRIGWQDDDVYEVEWAWSTGLELKMEPIGRPEDVLAVAFGQAITSDDLDLGDEEHLEIYYRLQLTDYLALSPSFQYFWDPMGDDDTYDDFAVFGIRSQINF